VARAARRVRDRGRIPGGSRGEQRLQAATPPAGDPRRGEQQGQRLHGIAPPAGQVEVPGEQLRGETRGGADQRGAPEAAARRRGEQAAQVQPQARGAAPLAVAGDLGAPGELAPAG